MQLVSFKDRMRRADDALQAEQAPPKDSPQADIWFNPVARLKGKPDFDGYEYLESAQILDALEVPMRARRSSTWRRITKLMVAQDPPWEPIRIKRNGVDGGGVTERVREFRRKTDRLPYPNAPAGVAGNSDSDFVMSHVVGRLEQDSRWQLAASVRKLLAERNALREQLEGR
jgi:hypothetical protein